MEWTAIEWGLCAGALTHGPNALCTQPRAEVCFLCSTKFSRSCLKVTKERNQILEVVIPLQNEFLTLWVIIPLRSFLKTFSFSYFYTLRENLYKKTLEFKFDAVLKMTFGRCLWRLFTGDVWTGDLSAFSLKTGHSQGRVIWCPLGTSGTLLQSIYVPLSTR